MLALTELCTNIVRHGYQGAEDEGNIQVALGKDGNRLRLVTMDSAPVFQPQQVAAPEPGALSEGGYGLSLIHSTMDAVTYEAVGEIGNRITLKREDRISGQQQ